MKTLTILGVAWLLALVIVASATVVESAPRVATIEVKGLVCQA